MPTLFGGDDYQLFTRPETPQINARFSVSEQGQRRVSLKAADLTEAHRRAQTEWHECRVLAEAGLVVTNKKFADIAEDYISGLERAVERGDKPGYHTAEPMN